MVCFVGLDAYTAADGGIRRDLFADDDSGTYLTDAALLEALVRGKLDALAEDEDTVEALEQRREQVGSELQAVEHAL